MIVDSKLSIGPILRADPPISRRKFHRLAAAGAALAAVEIAGCRSSSAQEVVVYTAHDQEFAEPVFARFTTETGIAVLPKFDTESTKTVGLAEALLAEKSRPRADVLWNNEMLHTIRLAKAGVLAAYKSDIGNEYPSEYRAADGLWYGFAARARVVVVNTQKVAEKDRPTGLADLTAPAWRAKCGLAKPLFGTTASQAAALFSVWGDEKAEKFFKDVAQNQAQILAGNRRVAADVGVGGIAFGLTDTDDALSERGQGSPVAIVYPDQQPGGLGTLFIPNTVAIIRDGPNPRNAQRLVDFLLSPAVEKMLADGASGQIPLHPKTEAKLQVETPRTIRPMKVDWNAAAEAWPRSAKFLRELFATV